jgi:hypothetical protein
MPRLGKFPSLPLDFGLNSYCSVIVYLFIPDVGPMIEWHVSSCSLHLSLFLVFESLVCHWFWLILDPCLSLD